MSLRKKVALAFLVGALIIAVLSAFLYANFAEIERETAFLEFTDTVRSKSLQLRRHEKNYFLYAPAAAGEESAAIRAYLGELDGVLGAPPEAAVGRTAALAALVREYRREFAGIERLIAALAAESALFKSRSPEYASVSPLVEANFLDKPLEDAAWLLAHPALGSDPRLVGWLRDLDTAISEIRRVGEAILSSSKELDRSAREKVDAAIRRSRLAILAIYPLFLVVGLGTTGLVAGGAVRRLRALAAAVEETGRGHFDHPPSRGIDGRGDEVDLLTVKFYAMEDQLQERERELVQSKKLAAIGTLAAGVAHELNNPLNNISTTAQRLLKKAGDGASPPVRKGLDDIFGQTVRVKSIVGDLLEFARAREPHFDAVALGELLRAAWRSAAASRDTAAVQFHFDLTPPEIVLEADRAQLERVFINLFVNAVDAMPGGGTLAVRAVEGREISIRVADTGAGIAPEALEKIFEPFYSSKERGTGLGLAIVFGIVQRHRGTIRAESTPGAGTTFTITLPPHRPEPGRPGGGEEAQG